MPSRNRIKVYIADSYYHIYNRGVNKRIIFKDSKDYSVFLNLLKRYLDSQPAKDRQGREYEWLHDRLELVAFCLMPNHFHLMIYTNDETSMIRLIRGVATAYTRYFNTRHQRRGPLFEDAYKASRISNDSYLQHISRYIHLNPRSWQKWEWSSLPYYLGVKQADWMQPKRVLDLFDDPQDYEAFLSDYESYKILLDELKYELADY